MLSYFLNSRLLHGQIDFDILVLILTVKILSRLMLQLAAVRKSFYAACNNIIAKSRGVMEPVAVQLVKSYCPPLLVYCVGGLGLTSSAIRQLSVCWNDAFKKIFYFKRFESVRALQIEFGSIDFQHLYVM